MIWINLTFSYNWDRPPVGIVRVERSIFNELKKKIPPAVLGTCIWDANKFISVDLGTHEKGTAPCICAGDTLISISLDWNQEYTTTFYDLKHKHCVNVITCCYDLIPAIYPQYCVGDLEKHFTQYFHKLAIGSSCVMCISNNSETDLINLCNRIGTPVPSTKVFLLGDNVPQNDGIISEQITKLSSESFLLFVSSIERRKNHRVLYLAYHILRKKYPNLSLPKLVFVGMPGWGINDLLKDIELDPLTQNNIVQLHHVTDAELNLLYQKSFFCLYPSFYEGWGLPVGEALAMGKVVFSSSQGSLPEVGGDLVNYLDPYDANHWAEAIHSAVVKPDIIHAQEKIIKMNYNPGTWEKAADSILDVVLDVEKKSLNFQGFISIDPGYECSTINGRHQGPRIIEGNSPGILMFGPFWSLPVGSYEIEVEGHSSNEFTDEISFDFVEGRSNPVVLAAGISEYKLNSPHKASLWKCSFSIDKPLYEFQVRCFTNKNVGLSIHRIIIKKEKT